MSKYNVHGHMHGAETYLISEHEISVTKRKPALYFRENFIHLKSLRKISQMHLSFHTGICRTRISHFECGRTHQFQLTEIKIIADFFKVTVDDLLFTDLKRLPTITTHKVKNLKK